MDEWNTQTQLANEIGKTQKYYVTKHPVAAVGNIVNIIIFGSCIH